jgi:transcriptional regulator of acetoin/glycerol metabolism
MNRPVDGITPAALQMIMKYPWKGNVRELENAIERAMVVTQENRLIEQDFLLNNIELHTPFKTSLSLDDVEKAHIVGVLENNNWNISHAARVLGIDRVTIYKKLLKYGIKRPENA